MRRRRVVCKKKMTRALDDALDAARTHARIPDNLQQASRSMQQLACSMHYRCAMPPPCRATAAASVDRLCEAQATRRRRTHDISATIARRKSTKQ